VSKVFEKKSFDLRKRFKSQTWDLGLGSHAKDSTPGLGFAKFVSALSKNCLIAFRIPWDSKRDETINNKSEHDSCIERGQKIKKKRKNKSKQDCVKLRLNLIGLRETEKHGNLQELQEWIMSIGFGCTVRVGGIWDRDVFTGGYNKGSMG